MFGNAETLAQLNTALIGANSRWGENIRTYAAAQELAYNAYTDGLKKQNAADAADAAAKKAIVGLAVSVVATSAIIYFAGATTLQGALSNAVMKKIAGPRQVLVPKYSFNQATKIFDVTYSARGTPEMSQLGAFLFGTAYGEASKHITGSIVKVMTSSSTPSTTTPTSSARGGWSVENALLTLRDRASAEIARIASAIAREHGEKHDLFRQLSAAPFFPAAEVPSP